MVHTRGPGQLVFVTNFAPEDWEHEPDIFEKVLCQAICSIGPALLGAQNPDGYSPPTVRIPYMTRRAFLAHKVIQRQGKSSSRRDVKNSGERYDFKMGFRTFLVIHEFVLHGGAIFSIISDHGAHDGSHEMSRTSCFRDAFCSRRLRA